MTDRVGSIDLFLFLHVGCSAAFGRNGHEAGLSSAAFSSCSVVFCFSSKYSATLDGFSLQWLCFVQTMVRTPTFHPCSDINSLSMKISLYVET